MMLLVGHQRGASRFMSRFMEKLGFDTPHDEWGKDGMVTTITAHDKNMSLEDIEQLLDEHDVIQFARAPRRCISTIFNVDMYGMVSRDPMFHWPVCGRYIGDWIDRLTPLELASMSYFWWHDLYWKHEPSLVVRVENDLPKLCSFLGKEMIDTSDIDRTGATAYMNEYPYRREPFWGHEIHKYVGAPVSNRLKDIANRLGYNPETLDVSDHSMPD